MHAYIPFPGLQRSKACSSYSPLLVWGCGRDSCLVWFLEAGGVCGFVAGWDFYFQVLEGEMVGWFIGLFFFLLLICCGFSMHNIYSSMHLE